MMTSKAGEKKNKNKTRQDPTENQHLTYWMLEDSGIMTQNSERNSIQSRILFSAKLSMKFEGREKII